MGVWFFVLINLAFAKIEPSMIPPMFNDRTVKVGQCYRLNKINYPAILKITGIDEQKSKYQLEIYLPIEKNKQIKYNKMFAEGRWAETASSWTLLDKCVESKDIL